MLPTTASGRFRFMLAVGLCVLAFAIVVLIASALAPVHLGRLAL